MHESHNKNSQFITRLANVRVRVLYRTLYIVEHCSLLHVRVFTI